MITCREINVTGDKKSHMSTEKDTFRHVVYPPTCSRTLVLSSDHKDSPLEYNEYAVYNLKLVKKRQACLYTCPTIHLTLLADL